MRCRDLRVLHVTPAATTRLSSTLCLGIAVCLVVTAAADQQLDICDHVEDELTFDSVVNSAGIAITCNDGIVTLDGTVDNFLAKDRAVRLAQAVRGVRSVVNRIRIVPSTMRSDGELRADIERALLHDPATDSYEVAATVSDGEATLTGTVDSWQERELVATVAKGVRGVKAITNKIDVDYQMTRSDAEIRNEIEQAIKFSVLLDPASIIDVSVDSGDVSLSGSVGSASEKARAEVLAWVAGVNNVNIEELNVVDWADASARRNTKWPDVSDTDVQQAVNDALLYDPRTLSFNVDVSVDNGTVTLRGTVDNLKAKRSAEQDARNTVGVWSVNNRLMVQLDTPPTDSEIEDRIDTALLRSPATESFEITTTVNNAIVNLYGTVDTFYEKTQAEDIASRVTGVAWVNNNRNVENISEPYVYDPYVDFTYPYTYGWNDYDPGYTFESDAEIEEDINDELWWSPFVDADEVTVAVSDGKATLTGEVDSWHERQSAAENAIEGGATSVTNQLTIDVN